MAKAGSKPRGDKPRNSRRGEGGSNGTMKFIIESDLSQQREIQKRILDAVEDAGFTSDSVFAVKISLEEALINAIKHGNKLDPKKKVRIEASVSPGETEIIIEDQGPGFDRGCVPDPTSIENIEKCSGRGILLIEAYMDEVEWTNRGRRLRMMKRNADGAA